MILDCYPAIVRTIEMEDDSFAIEILSTSNDDLPPQQIRIYGRQAVGDLAKFLVSVLREWGDEESDPDDSP